MEENNNSVQEDINEIEENGIKIDESVAFGGVLRIIY